MVIASDFIAEVLSSCGHGQALGAVLPKRTFFKRTYVICVLYGTVYVFFKTYVILAQIL